jgi:uncharacterized protein (TIGR02145 family)
MKPGNLLVILLLFITKLSSANEFLISGFREFATDMTARTKPRKDVNEQDCAIIKVLSDIKGILFESNLGIVGNVVRETPGEYLVYVSPGEKVLKFIKEGYVSYYFEFPLSIQESRVYQMKVISKETDDNKLSSGTLFIETIPAGAEVYVNNEYKGKSPYQSPLLAGDYNYNVKKKYYYPQQGKFVLKTDSVNELVITLKKNYGSLTLNTLPEQGATVEIDGITHNSKTPVKFDTLFSGKHTLSIKLNMYDPVTQEFSLVDEENKKLDIKLKPLFAEYSVITNAGADISINGEKKGTGKYSGRLPSGVKIIEIKKEKYYPVKREINIIAGDKYDPLNIELKPVIGSLSIITNPPRASFYLDNEAKGKTPAIINELIIGKYELKIIAEGYKEYKKQIEIKEGERLYFSDSLKKETIIPAKLLKTKNSTSSKCEGTIMDYDGNTYNIVRIGDQCWMKQNLATTHYADGTALVDGTNAGNITGNYTTKYWFVNNGNITYKSTYGLLYTWAAAMNGAVSSNNSPSGVQGVCPTGWHVPSDAEWTYLTNYLGGSTVAGDKLKEAGTAHWYSPNTGATNESGFTALPGGLRVSDGAFYYVGGIGHWWSSTEDGATHAWDRGLGCLSSGIFSSNYGGYFKSFGCSVRCLRDY